jgi:hypothetical protein
MTPEERLIKTLKRKLRRNNLVRTATALAVLAMGVGFFLLLLAPFFF